MIGGAPKDIRNYNAQLNLGHQTLAECVKELIETAYDIYTTILQRPHRSTIICGGQSPAYYCLAMMQFSIYNPDKANILILPHSKGGIRSTNQSAENMLYCQRLTEKEILIRNDAIIIDGVQSGVGIMALESALKFCYPDINVTKIAINANLHVAEIVVDNTYAVPSAPFFSGTFPRLITSYRPEFFHNATTFITEFTIDENPVAEMIIDIAKDYPRIKVEDTEWYRINHRVTEAIAAKKARFERERARELERALERERERQLELERRQELLEEELGGEGNMDPEDLARRMRDDRYEFHQGWAK
jgi:hypothetical protein